MNVHLSEYINNTSVESVKLGKALELSKHLRLRFCRKSSPMLDRVNWGQRSQSKTSWIILSL